MRDIIKAPRKGIRITQGPTTAVYFLWADNYVLRTIIMHHWPRPVLFRKARRLL